MEEFEVGAVIIGKQFENSENYKKFKKIVNNKKIQVLEVEEGNKIKIEDNLYFDVLWPDCKNTIKENILNNNSLVCRLVYNNFSMLFTGDIEEIAEKAILKNYKNNLGKLKSTILKVAHHGSKTSTTQKLLKEINPKIALIGVGENNTFGHPNSDVLNRLNKTRCQSFKNR